MTNFHEGRELNGAIQITMRDQLIQNERSLHIVRYPKTH